MAAVIMIAAISAFPFAQPSKQYHDLVNTDTRQLIVKGEKWLQKENFADSALVYFSLAASRYSPELSKSDKELTVKAAIGKWLVYFSYLFDYPKAYESLQQASEICEKENIDKSDVDISMGGMLQVMADQGASPELYRQSVIFYSRGYMEAVAAGRIDAADRAFVNLLTVSHLTQDFDSVRSLWKIMSRLPCKKDNHRRKFAISMYKAITSHEDAFLSVGIIDSALKILPQKAEYRRLAYIGRNIKADILNRADMLDSAAVAAVEARDFARSHSIKDGEMEATKLLYEILERKGDAEESLEAHDEYLRLKEILLGSKQIQKLDELRFLADIRKADEELALMKERHHRQGILIILLCLLIVAVGAALWVYFSKNAKLKDAYDSLYRQMQAKVSAENKITAQPSFKVQGEERERIINNVNEITSTSDAIYTPDFTVARMAELAGCNAKYLSQIINDTYGCNFNNFINEFRIKEAARRMLDGGEYAMYTIEAIANSVGFRSRSTFVGAFKQFTGLTPSEFKKRAQSGNNI